MPTSQLTINVRESGNDADVAAFARVYARLLVADIQGENDAIQEA